MRALLFFGWLLATVLLFAPDDSAIAGHATTHWDFERAEDVDAWGVVFGNLSWSPDRGVNGSAAATLTVAQESGNIARAGHPASVVPGGLYQLRGQLTSTGGQFEWAHLNLSLGNSNAFNARTKKLFGAGEWSLHLPVPCDAVRGEVGVTVQGAPGSTANIDEISLELVAPPSTPCPALAPTPDTQPAPSPDGLPPPGDAPASKVPVTIQQPASPRGLLTNYGFEAAEGGVLTRWRIFGGVLTQTATPVHSGRFAAAFSSASESTKWVYQTVRVTPVAWYQFDGFVYLNDPRAEAALLRISWYTSNDGSGRAVATVDSTMLLEEPAARYRYLTTGPVQAPPGVRSARLRILLRPRSAARTVIYIDDVSFRPSAPGPNDTAASGATRRSSRRSASDAPSSPALGQSGVAFPLTPFPTPVIVRGSRLHVEESALSDGGAAAWAWAIFAGGVVLAAGMGGNAVRSWRTRRA